MLPQSKAVFTQYAVCMTYMLCIVYTCFLGYKDCGLERVETNNRRQIYQRTSH